MLVSSGWTLRARCSWKADARVNKQGHRASFLRSEASRLPFTNQSVNTLTCMGLMKYLDDANLTLQEISRVLARGGTAIITLAQCSLPLPHVASFYGRRLRKLKAEIREQSLRPHGGGHPRPLRPGCGGVPRVLGQRLQQRLRKFGLKTEDVCYYNFKINLTPLDKWLLRLSLQTTRRLESLARGPMRFLATASIVKA